MPSFKDPYVWETHAYERPYSRSNQAIEGSNRSKNDINREINNYSKNTFLTWVKLAAYLEKIAANRYETIKRHKKYRSKNKKCITRDNLIAHTVKEQKRFNLTTDEYVKEIMRINSMGYV